jgi:sirohydrochlorin ferrochelatase
VNRRGLCLAFAAALLAAQVSGGAQAPASTGTGILLLAHGGSGEWNKHVAELAEAVDRQQPVEVALGMASRPSIQAAVDRLVSRGVTSIVAVPLFVSSHSSVITATEFLLGQRAVAPKDLALFARMDHSGHGASHDAGASHTGAGHASAPAPDPTSPVTLPVPVTMTSALNRHPLVGDILSDRAREISKDPSQEAVVLVAHGPVPDEDNRRWLDDMAVLARQVQLSAPYAAVHALTVRDDAGPAMREVATKELRELVERETASGRRVLIVPHLLSFGGIEQGIRKRLDGLTYTMATQALIPDARLQEWVLEQSRRGSIAP